MAQQEAITSRIPVITLSCALAAWVAYCWPEVSNLLVYDRQEILDGEAWRLMTAPLVHFSASHFFWNVLVLGLAGWKIEAAGYRSFWVVCGLAAVMPGPIFLLASPEIARYGGLSGVASGAVAYLCLCEAKGSNANRILWFAILALAGMKPVVEAATGAAVFATAADTPFHVLPSVHLLGCVAALAALPWHRTTPAADSPRSRSRHRGARACVSVSFGPAERSRAREIS